MIRSILIALQLLTRIPVSIKGEVTPAELGRSAAAFPVAGLLIGLILSGVYVLAINLWPASIAAVLVLTAMVFVTGGLHIDGLMDTADGVFSGRSRERMLEIMRDSRVGSMGVMAAVLVYLLKFVSITAMPAATAVVGLIGAPVLSRWAMVAAISAYPYARSGPGTGKPYADYVSRREFYMATVIALLIVGGIWRWPGSLVAVAAVVVAVMLAYFLNSRLGGLTGDCYGAVNETVEAVILLVIAAGVHLG